MAIIPKYHLQICIFSKIITKFCPLFYSEILSGPQTRCGGAAGRCVCAPGGSVLVVIGCIFWGVRGSSLCGPGSEAFWAPLVQCGKLGNSEMFKLKRQNTLYLLMYVNFIFSVLYALFVYGAPGPYVYHCGCLYAWGKACMQVPGLRMVYGHEILDVLYFIYYVLYFKTQ